MLTVFGASSITPGKTGDHILVFEGCEERRRRIIAQRSEIDGLRIQAKYSPNHKLGQ